MLPSGAEHSNDTPMDVFIYSVLSWAELHLGISLFILLPGTFAVDLRSSKGYDSSGKNLKTQSEDDSVLIFQ